MANGADVRSLEALEELLRRLAPFKDRLGKQLDEVRFELQRIARWLESELPLYWRQQEKLSERQWKEARLVLTQCESYVRIEERRNCTEQRKQLERATERLGLCKRRLSHIQTCQLEWQQTCLAVIQRLQHVVDIADVQMPLARMHLDRLLEPLRLYAQLGVARPPRSEALPQDPHIPDRSSSLEDASDAGET